MSLNARKQVVAKSAGAAILIVIMLLLAFPPGMRAQQSEEHDNYKLKLDGFWFYSNPTGSIQGHFDGTPDPNPIDFHRDLAFSSYSTFTGKIDWKFTHKNHLYVAIAPFYTSQTVTLAKDITFQGTTFAAGSTVTAELHPLVIAPGYQYDFIRRRRGHIGLGVQIDIFNTSAKISGTGQVSGGGITGSASGSASASLLAPIPVAGPEFRLYLTDSAKVFIEGNVYGMYLFGYGDFVSTTDTIGITLRKHVSLNLGYQLGSRLNVTGTSNRAALSLTQKGPIAGVELYFWQTRLDARRQPRSRKERFCKVRNSGERG